MPVAMSGSRLLPSTTPEVTSDVTSVPGTCCHFARRAGETLEEKKHRKDAVKASKVRNNTCSACTCATLLPLKEQMVGGCCRGLHSGYC
jgi:hypothetical protein